MQAGTLKYRLSLERPVKVVEAGTRVPKVTYTTTARPWGAYLPVTGKERIAAGQPLADFDAVFRIRWRDDVDVTWRVVHDETTYRILSVTPWPPNSTRIGMELLTKAETPARA